MSRVVPLTATGINRAAESDQKLTVRTPTNLPLMANCRISVLLNLGIIRDPDTASVTNQVGPTPPPGWSRCANRLRFDKHLVALQKGPSASIFDHINPGADRARGMTAKGEQSTGERSDRQRRCERRFAHHHRQRGLQRWGETTTDSEQRPDNDFQALRVQKETGVGVAIDESTRSCVQPVRARPGAEQSMGRARHRVQSVWPEGWKEQTHDIEV
ncbi:hypothetical protein CERZMDRAFT_92757 [Cercospora zeae-maydis SCOH1-5]|uniref:Uncharacterized protein n=1 Tax=Cercospora zeae-maydis SCOH1-5 TaxID=717836 RepID=A0A6A6FT63_9PEZI|nr:hypothetical protein CERZMDRAFT_92757 [Cercospora zeae-maydis SCOH1-5]